MAIEAATKAPLYAALLPTIGASAAFLFVTAPASGRARGSRAAAGRAGDPLDAAVRRVGLIASACVVVALALRAWAQAEAAFGLADSFSLGSLATVAIDSRWGRRWQLQVPAAFACVLAYAVSHAAEGASRGPRRRSRASRSVFRSRSQATPRATRCAWSSMPPT